LYDAELKLSGVLVIIVIVASGIVAITIFDKQTRAFIPSYRDTIVYVTLLQMFGLYSKTKKMEDQKTGKADYICPDCKVDMMARYGCRNYDGKKPTSVLG
jgi:amino acid permease